MVNLVKRLTILFFIFTALFSASFIAMANAKEVVFLHTNDIESVYSPVEAFWSESITRIGGIPNLSTLINEQRSQADTTFLLDAGDIFTGSLAKQSSGKFVFDVYSEMGYDAVNIGNHEFEYGWKTFSDNMPRARFPILCANIFYADTNIPFARPYAILEKDGIRVAVIGAMGIEAFYNTIAKKNREGLIVKDPAAAIQQWVDYVHDDVDVVVVLTHQNKSAPMQTDKQADAEVQRGFDEDYALAGKLKNVDMIFGGHSDNGLLKPVVHPDTGIVIGITFGQGMHLGYTKFSVDTAAKAVVYNEGYLIPVDSDKYPANPKIRNMLIAAENSYPQLSQVVAHTDKFAYRRFYRESNIGNLITDMLKQETNADIAIIGSGNIRADINAGDVTVAQVMDVFPFTDTLAVVEIEGRHLKALFEYSYSLSYGLAQASGIDTQYDSKRKDGERLMSINVGGKPVDKDKIYRIATNSFVATGGDGYEVMKNGTVFDTGKSVTDILINAFSSRRSVKIPEIGHQVDVSEHLIKKD